MSHRDKADDDGGGDAGQDEGPRKSRRQVVRDRKRISALTNASSIGWDGRWPTATGGDMCAPISPSPHQCYFRLWSYQWMMLQS